MVGCLTCCFPTVTSVPRSSPEQFRMFARSMRVLVLKGAPDDVMQGSTLMIKQALVGHFLRQHMLEPVADLRRHIGLLNEP